MSAIYKRELRAYFSSPMGYIIVAAIMAVLDFSYFLLLFFYGRQMEIGFMLAYLNIPCLILIPIMTMRLLSEERNKKTDQLILTSPVSLLQIVLGKYFAACTVFLAGIVLSFVFPVIFFLFGEPSLAMIIGNYLGYILLWCAMISIGLFVSSITENQMISAVMTCIILLVLYLLEMLVPSINIPVLQPVLKSLLLFSRFNDFSQGLLNVTTIVYYLSFIAVFLFATVRVLDKRRYS